MVVTPLESHPLAEVQAVPGGVWETQFAEEFLETSDCNTLPGKKPNTSFSVCPPHPH